MEIKYEETAVVTAHLVKKDGSYSANMELSYLTKDREKFKNLIGSVIEVPMRGRQAKVIICHVTEDRDETKKAVLNASFSVDKFVYI